MHCKLDVHDSHRLSARFPAATVKPQNVARPDAKAGRRHASRRWGLEASCVASLCTTCIAHACRAELGRDATRRRPQRDARIKGHLPVALMHLFPFLRQLHERRDDRYILVHGSS